MTSSELGRVGYIDDGQEFDGYRELLEDFINLLIADECSSLDDIWTWVLKNQIECLVIDHKLTNKYEFLGTEVVSYINKHLPDLPCLILTSYKNDSMNKKLVIECLTKDRKEIIEGDNYKGFGEQLKQACEVFKTRLKKRIEEYNILYDKKTKQTISPQEEEDLKQVYILLRAYGEIDEIPAEFLTSEMSKKIDDLLTKIDVCISSCKDKKDD